MLAQALQMTHLEPGCLHRGHDTADFMELSVREHVPVGEVTPEPRCREAAVVHPTRVRRAADAVVQQSTFWSQQAPAPAEVMVELGETYVLEHADRTDGVVGPVIDVAKVAEADLDSIGEAELGGALARELSLRT